MKHLRSVLATSPIRIKKIIVAVYLRQGWGSILFRSFSRGSSGLIDKIRGEANAMATRVILHLLGYNCNLYAGIGDQLKTLNVHENLK